MILGLGRIPYWFKDTMDEIAKQNHDVKHRACNEQIAALTAEVDALKEHTRVVSSCYGDLPDSVAELIEGHEWDNKTPSEQRDWAVSQVAALKWQPITPENLPKVGDEVLRHTRLHSYVESVGDPCCNEWPYSVWKNIATHFRPINAPAVARATPPQSGGKG